MRTGDYRWVLVEASGHEPSVEQAPATLIATDVIGRNSIKYQAREYRHAFWDSGTILANTLANAAAHQLSARVIAGFLDARVSSLLDLDPQRELALALVPISAEPAATIQPSPPFAPLNLTVQPITEHEIDFPAIRTMHAASMLFDPDAVAAWRGTPPRSLSLPPAGPLIPLQPLTRDTLPLDPLEQVIVRRGSTRQFTHESITFEQLSTVLYQSLQGVPADFLEPAGVTLNNVYLTIHAVDGLMPGTYMLRRDTWALELLKPGDFRETSGYLGLEQKLAYDASISGGRIYLASYAQHFGATGLTFYDDAVIDFFSPHAHNKDVMFMIALGHKARRRA